MLKHEGALFQKYTMLLGIFLHMIIPPKNNNNVTVTEGEVIGKMVLYHHCSLIQHQSHQSPQKFSFQLF